MIIIIYFQRIFKGSRFYYEWIYEEVGVYFNATSSKNDKRGNETLVAHSCYKVIKSREEDRPTSDNAIKARSLFYPVSFAVAQVPPF